MTRSTTWQMCWHPGPPAESREAAFPLGRKLHRMRMSISRRGHEERTPPSACEHRATTSRSWPAARPGRHRVERRRRQDDAAISTRQEKEYGKVRRHRRRNQGPGPGDAEAGGGVRLPYEGHDLDIRGGAVVASTQECRYPCSAVHLGRLEVQPDDPARYNPSKSRILGMLLSPRPQTTTGSSSTMTLPSIIRIATPRAWAILIGPLSPTPSVVIKARRLSNC